MHTRLLSLLLLLLTQPALALLGDEEPLSPEEAFKPAVSEASPGVIEATWDITEGYYLYRDKISISSNTPGIILEEPTLPPGKVKDDEFFGRIETYRNRVTAQIPYQGQAEEISLELGYQGCADMGICYPPQKTLLSFRPGPQAAIAAPAATGLDVLKELRNSTGLGAEPELLPADEAFAFSAEVVNGNIRAQWQIAEGYYLYKNKIKLALTEPAGATLGAPDFPPPLIEKDPELGDTESYRGPLTLNYPLGGAISGPMTLTAEFQGCADAGVCYPPIRKTLTLDNGIGIAAVPTPAVESESKADTAAPAAPPLSEQDAIAQKLAHSNVLVTLISFFGFGLLLALTPCVFPMIPILSGIIIGSGDKTSASKSFMLSLAYVLAMALTYTVVGVAAGLLGTNLQAWLQNPWVLGSFAAVFVILAFSMFGFYELQMPGRIQNKLTEISNRQESGKLISAAVMGFLSALIVGPCVTAPLIGALSYIAQTGDAFLGGMALFTLSLGMGVPLLLIGASAGKLLPKAGPWMDTVKAVFGVLMIAVAIWLLERVLPTQITMLLWALLLIVSGVYMGALRHLQEHHSGWFKLWKGLGYAILFYGSLLLIGVASGSNNLLQPLKGFGALAPTRSAMATESHAELFERIKSVDDLSGKLAQAKTENRPVMLDFYADWCVSCKELEKFTFSDPGVQSALSQAILLQADVTANDELDRELMKTFGIIGPPAILFFNPEGNEQRSFRLVGYVAADPFKTHATNAFNQP